MCVFQPPPVLMGWLSTAPRTTNHAQAGGERLCSTSARQPKSGLAKGLARRLLVLSLASCWIGSGSLGLDGTGTASAQSTHTPSTAYYLAKSSFYAGEYRQATRGFADAMRGGVRVGFQRWVDAICYHTMAGESFYQMGNLTSALREYEAALDVYLQQPNWIARINFPAIGPTNEPVRAGIVWAPQRGTIIGHFPDSMKSAEGNPNLQSVIQNGGVVSLPIFRSLDVVEVVRCMAVALRRRAELLGPTARFSPRSSLLVTALSADFVPSGHWARAWTEILQGLALLGKEETDSAINHLAAGVMAGVYDHPLTGIALLELGKIALQAGDADRQQILVAGNFFLQATLAAAEFGQADIVEEAFRYCTDTFLAAGSPAPFPALDRAAFWAQQKEFYHLQASLLVNAAEIAVYAGQPAAGFLQQARRVMARRDLPASRLGGRANYVAALAAYQEGQLAVGNGALTAAMTYMSRGSLRLYHLGLVDTLYMSGSEVISPRIAEGLYSRVLDDPTDLEWGTAPMEAIAFLLSSHTLPMEHWFELLLDRKEYGRALEVSEQLRRHRFYSSLPMGGRLLALRWLFEGHPDMLGKTGIRQANELRVKYPQFGALSANVRQLQLELARLPFVPTDDAQAKQQRGLASQLEAAAASQELLVRQIALRRDPSKLVFPPQPGLEPIQRALAPDEGILLFVTTSRQWHGFFLRNNEFINWEIRAPGKVQTELAKLLREIGNQERNHAVPVRDLNDDWKGVSAELWQILVGDLPPDSWKSLRELIIVPDGPLWYLPFETLQVKEHNEPFLLRSRVRVRYAPTASLAVGDRRGRPRDMKTALVVGKILPRADGSGGKSLVEKLQATLPGTEIIAKPPFGSSAVLCEQWNRLIVWDDIEGAEKGPYAWSPAQVDRGRAGSTLADWMELPWGAPDQILLPGFHTAAEANLRRGAVGYEIFLSLCGLMSTGTRTVLLSRWNVGGPSAASLVQEFARELPHETAAAAWQRSVNLLQASELDASLEPRLKSTAEDGFILGEHPFLWAGYLLVDTGASPNRTALDLEKPAAGNAPSPNDRPATDDPKRLPADKPAAPGAAAPDDAKKDDAKIDRDVLEAIGLPPPPNEEELKTQK